MITSVEKDIQDKLEKIGLPLVQFLETPGDAASCFEVKLSIKDDVEWFKGHFPGQAVLPGVVQVFWVEQFIRTLYEVPETGYEIKSLKFSSTILPNTDVILTIEHEINKRRWKFRYWYGSTSFSSGIFLPEEGRDDQ